MERMSQTALEADLRPAQDARRVSRMRALEAPVPVPQPQIGVSPRPGQGYDLSRFQRRPEYTSLFPVGMTEPRLGRYPTRSERTAHEVASNTFAETLSSRREMIMGTPGGVRNTLSGMHGLFLPGDANRNPTQVASPSSSNTVSDAAMNEPSGALEIRERETRDPFEQAAVREARNRGMPVLAVCGGSWRCLEAYGGQVETIPENEREMHRGRLPEAAHDLSVARHTVLGGAAERPLQNSTSSTPPAPSYLVRGSNSTHWAMASVHEGQLVQRENASTESFAPHAGRELVVTAWEPGHGHPEAFESRHGAPVVGIQSHPEYFLASRSGHETADFANFSERLFRGFQQASQAFANRQAVNAEIKQRVGLIPPHSG